MKIRQIHTSLESKRIKAPLGIQDMSLTSRWKKSPDQMRQISSSTRTSLVSSPEKSNFKIVQTSYTQGIDQVTRSSQTPQLTHRLSTASSSKSTKFLSTGKSNTFNLMKSTNTSWKEEYLVKPNSCQTERRAHPLSVSSSSQKLDFLGTTCKSSYIDLKSKRQNDLNTLYTEKSNSTNFTSQNVFMNRLIYTPEHEPENDKTKIINSGIIPPVHEGLTGFVKTMYSGKEHGNQLLQKYNQQKSANFQTNDFNRQFDKSNSQIIRQTEQYAIQEKPKDVFITKLSNSLITQKFLLFQNQPDQIKTSREDIPPIHPSLNIQKKLSMQKNYISKMPSALQRQLSVKRVPSLQTQEDINSDTILKPVSNQNIPQFQLSNNSIGNLLIPQTSQLLLDQEQQLEFIEDKSYLSEDKKIREKVEQNFTQQPKTGYFSFQSKEYLFVLISNLNDVKRKGHLKYTFLQIPEVRNLMSEKQINLDFKNLKNQLQSDLQLFSKEIYLFLDDGTPLRNHQDIVFSTNSDTRAIFVGGNGGFCGIENLFISPEKKVSLKKVINQLIYGNSFSRKKQINSNNRTSSLHLDVNIPSENDLINKLEMNSDQFRTRESYFKESNQAEIDRVVNILTQNPGAKIKRFEKNFENPRIKKFTKIEKIYDDSINKLKRSLVEVEATSSLGDDPESNHIKNLKQIAEYLYECDDIGFQKEPIQLDKLVQEEYNTIFNQIEQPQFQEKKNFIKSNIEKHNSITMAMKQVQDKNRELFLQNIPQILSEYKLSRRDLHSIYILYKALLSVSIQRINWHDVYKGGIDFRTFEHGIDKISSQSEEIIRRMCNYQDFINWKQFIDILYAVSGKTLESKIDLFIKVADTDKSGKLSKEEISELCYICLDKIIPKNGDDDSMVQDLVEYFTRLLFESLGVDSSEEIPLNKLKDAILNGHPENDLLCFFCGVDTAN